MPLNSIHNGRGFFSDYWLGSIMTSKRKSRGPKLTPAQSRKLMRRLSQLRQRVDTLEPVPLTQFREKFARPLLDDIFNYFLLEADDETRIRSLTAKDNNSELPESGGNHVLSLVLMEPHPDKINDRKIQNNINKALLENDIDYGFILTPDILRLVRKPGEGHKNAYFDFAIATASETEDTESLSTAWRILNASSFIPGDDGHLPIEALEKESRKHSAGVSEFLKQSVFSSAEMLIQGFLQYMRQNPLFPGKTDLNHLRNAVLQCLYRILFIFYAESRDERLQTHKLYLESYSLERLIDRLLNRPLHSFAGNRFSFWSHIRVLFKIYNDGLDVGNIPGLQNIPPRGGTLFSEKTKEGKLLSKIKLPDRLVAELLRTLGTSRPRRGVGRERISFRELEIEQLGAVYEGLLEYEPRVAECVRIEAKVQGKEYILEPLELLRLCEQKNLQVKGNPQILENTGAESLHQKVRSSAFRRAFLPLESGTTNLGNGVLEEEVDDQKALNSDGEGEEDQGVKKGSTCRLTRRFEAGDFYFVPGAARKASGSYYTSEEIVQYLVRNTLGDLVRGKISQEIENLKIIDPACGSGHFLVGAAKFLGKKLHETYQKENSGEPPEEFYPYRNLDAKVKAEWEKEGEAWCKRRIVERCLFGVDLNPTAVQLAQVALWIESLAGDRPLSFFAHHVRTGNSLLGTWLDRFHEAPYPSFHSSEGHLRGLFEQTIDKEIEKAFTERLLIDSELPAEVHKDTPEEYEYKADRLKQAESTLTDARLLFDLRNAAALLPEIWSEWPNILLAEDIINFSKNRPWWNKFQEALQKERFFHWELEFPEIFFGDKKGFDCVLGNPPWEKIKPDRKEFYGKSDILIRAYTGGELDVRIKELHQAYPGLDSEFKKYQQEVKTTAACLKKGGEYEHCDWIVDGRSTGGDPDLFKFFLERGHRILRIGGRLGFLIPSALYNNEGCTGLRYLLLDESKVLSFFGFENRKKIFKIDSRYKFVCLVIQKKARQSNDKIKEDVEFRAAFMRHDLEELDQTPPQGVEVLVRKSELEKLSPGTLAFLEYRSERDREIIKKMYGLLPGMKPRPLLGDRGEGTWNTKFYTEFHMTNDRDLWTKPNGKLWTPKEVCGLNWPEDPSIPFEEVRQAMDKKGFWPLYEGKIIDVLLYNVQPVMRWVSLDKAKNKYSSLPEGDQKIAYREVASNTNERTCLASLISEKTFCNHKLWVLRCSNNLNNKLLFIVTSFIFDFLVRLKIGGTGLSQSHMSRTALPAPNLINDDVNIFCVDSFKQNLRSVYEYESFWKPLWLQNKIVAKAYGLNATDFEHILTTFPVFARKRPEFFNFLMQKVKEWKDKGY